MIDSKAVEALNLSTRLRLLREERGWSQKDASRRSGIPKSTYENYERCNSLPDYINMKKLGRLFDVSLDWLAGMDDEWS